MRDGHRDRGPRWTEAYSVNDQRGDDALDLRAVEARRRTLWQRLGDNDFALGGAHTRLGEDLADDRGEIGRREIESPGAALHGGQPDDLIEQLPPTPPPPPPPHPPPPT